MKISLENENIILVPEDDFDCFNLGKLSLSVAAMEIIFSHSTDDRSNKMKHMTINLSLLFNFIFGELLKKNRE